MIDTTSLERASATLEPVERDDFGILRFRTPSEVIARGVAATLKGGGYGVAVLEPRHTWHKMWSVSAWGDYMITSDGPVPITL